MKVYFSIVLIASFIFGCAKYDNDESAVLINHPVVDKSKLEYNNKTSIWSLNNQPFSGYAIDYFENGMRKEKFGVLNGRKEGEAKAWFPNGNIRQSANYKQGKLHGEKLTYSSESKEQLLSHLTYKLGKVHGTQKKWYPSGEIFKILNLNMGVEEGMQQAFRKNGDLYANYEAKEGRIYGLKRSSLCFGLEDEKVM